MARPPVYEAGLFELSIDPSKNPLDNTCKQSSTLSTTDRHCLGRG